MALDPFHQLHVYRHNAKNDRQVTDCYRLLYHEKMWNLAIQRTCKNENGKKYTALVESMINEVKEGTFRFRDMHNNMCPDGKTRNLLMQESIMIILQSVYGDMLESRINQSMVKALHQIKTVFGNMTWCISGVIDFSRIRSAVFCQLAAQRIKDHRFMKLLHQFLKSMPSLNPSMQKKLHRLLIVICMNELIKQLNRKSLMSGRIELVCCRNNLVVGIAGSKREALRLNDILKDLVQQTLQLDSHVHNLSVSHLEKPVHLLGYCIKWTLANRHKTDNKDLLKKEIQIYVPTSQLQRIANELQYGDFVTFTSTRRSKIMNLSELEILERYNREMKRIIKYYHAAENIHCLLKLRALAQSSFLKTISSKRKTTPKKVAKSLVRTGYDGLWISYSSQGPDQGDEKCWISFITGSQLALMANHEKTSNPRIIHASK